MSFSGDTILVPEVYDLPTIFAFFKVVQDPDDIIMKDIYLISKRSYSRVVAKVADIDIFDDELMFLVKDNIEPSVYSASTNDYYIIEKDEIPGKVITKLENIGDVEENILIRELKLNPELSKKIPQELKERSSFKQKMLMERTKGRVRSLDSIGNSTGTIDIPEYPDGPLSHVNAMLGVTTTPSKLHGSRVEKTKRLARGGKKRIRKSKRLYRGKPTRLAPIPKPAPVRAVIDMLGI